MKVGTLEIEMLANLARLRKDMTDAKQIVGDSVAGIEKMVGVARNALATLGVGVSIKVFADIVQGSIDAMDHLNDLNKTTKISIENLAGLSLAAKQSGSDLDSIASSANKLATNMGKDAEKFRQLGITAKDPLEAFKQFADVFRQIEDPQMRAALGAAALGKKWEGAAPLLAEGSKQIAEMIERGKQLSGITKKNAEQADKFNDKMAEFQAAMKGSKDRIVGDMLPALTQMMTAITAAYERGGKLAAVIEAIGQVGRATIYGEYDDRIKSMDKDIQKLVGEYQRVQEALDEGPSIAEKIFGSQDDNLRTRQKQLFEQIGALRNEKTRLINLDKEAAAAAAAAKAANAQGDAAATAAAEKKAKAFLDDGKSAGAYTKELVALERQMAALKGAGELEAYTHKLQEDAFKGLTAAQKQNLIGMMAAIIAEKQLIEARREQIQSGAGLMNAQQGLMDLARDYAIALRENNNQLAFENSLVGKSAQEVRELSEARRIDLELLQALAAVPEDDASGTAEKLKTMAEAAKIRSKLLLMEGGLLATQEARWKNLANAAGQYFGKIGASVGKLISTMVDLNEQQAEYNRQRATALNITDPSEREEKLLKISKESTAVRLRGFGDMASAAAGFFDEQDRGYKALMAVSKVFHATELAMSIAELVPKAIGAVLNQGNGDPYTAFGRMAAMAAIVAGLGVAIGGVGGGSTNTDARDRQAAAGTGSVLGDDMAKSASIAKALDLLGKNSIIGNEHTAAMLQSLRAIENNIGGLASLVVRTSGLLGGKGDLGGLNLGKQSGGFLGLGASSNSLTDQGILIAAQTVGQARTGFQGSQYSDVTTTGRTWYGKSYSRTNRTTGALGGDLAAQFSQIIDSLAVSILQAAQALGAEKNSVAALLNNFNIAALDISLKGLKGSEIEEQLQAIFGKLGDDMAAAVLPGLGSFQKVGEGLFETLMRLAQEFAATDAIAIILGKDVKTAFGDIGMASIKARDDLVALFGGIEEMSEAVLKYVELYHSEGERLDRSTETLRQQFEALGTAMPGSLQAFRQLVEAQDLGTEAGRELFAALMQIAPAFHSVTTAAQTMVQTMGGLLQSIYGGTYGKQIAQGAFDQAANAWNSYLLSIGIGEAGYTAAQTFADLKNNPDLAAQVFAALQSGQLSAQGGDLFNQLLQAFQQLNQAIAGTDGATGNIDAMANAAQQYAEAMANAKSRLLGYLNGSKIGDLSPLTLAQKVNEARAQLQKQIGLAPTSIEAMAGLGASRDNFLKLLLQLKGFTPDYNAEYFSTFDQLNAFTGNAATRPMTAADAEQQTAQLIAALTGLDTTTNVGNALVAQLLDLIANGISVTDPAVTRLLEDIRNARTTNPATTPASVI